MAQLQIIECEQTSPEWHQARCGIITASDFEHAIRKTNTKIMSFKKPDLNNHRILNAAIKKVGEGGFIFFESKYFQVKKVASGELKIFLTDEDSAREMKDAISEQSKNSEDDKGRRTMILKIAGERIRGESADIFDSVYTDRGKRDEPEVIRLYEEIESVIVKPCGFMRLGLIGCSPDGLVGSDGTVEVKSKAPHLHLEVILSNEMPNEHKAQVQGGLMISGREWCDFICYCKDLPLFVKRVYRDNDYITMLRAELDKFNQEVEETINEILQRVA